MNYWGPGAHGSLYSDDVKIGGIGAKNVVLGNSYSKFLNLEEREKLMGLFGFSFPIMSSIDTDKKLTFVDLAKKQNSDLENVFQMLLKLDDDARINVGIEVHELLPECK